MAKKPTLKNITGLLNAIEDYEIKGEIQWIGPNGRRFRTSAEFAKYLTDTTGKTVSAPDPGRGSKEP